MALSAREWLLLPKEDMEMRKAELSQEECYKLRNELEMIHFTEEQKANMSEKEKYQFTHPKESTVEEKENFNKKADEIFKAMRNGRC